MVTHSFFLNRLDSVTGLCLVRSIKSKLNIVLGGLKEMTWDCLKEGLGYDKVPTWFTV